jgi:hypothetical protein
MKKIFFAAAVLLAAVAVPASPASATVPVSCLVSTVKGCIPPTRPDHYAVEECLSLHGGVNYGEVFTILQGYVFEDNCFSFIYIGSDGGQYRDTFNFTSTGGGGTLSIAGAATESECIAFRKTSPAQPTGEPTQWVWQAGLCTAGGTSGGGKTSGAGSKSVPPTHAATEECLSLKGTIGPDSSATNQHDQNITGGDDYACSFTYVDNGDEEEYDAVGFNLDGSIGNGGLIVETDAATESECVEFRAPGNPTQWVWQAGLCTV